MDCLKELLVTKGNQYFSLVKLPASKPAVGCRWVFTMNEGPFGVLAKAKLLAQEFTQQEGVDIDRDLFP